MKKIILCASMMLACVCAQAQFKVYDNGNIGINTTTTPTSPFCINAPGVNRTVSHIWTNNCGLIIGRTGTPTVNYNWWSGIEINMPPVGGNFNLGIKARAISSTTMNSGRAYGLWGEAGNTTDGYNYGVYGKLAGVLDGAGIYGTVGEDNGSDVDGQYAGYFNGDVKVTGTLYAPYLTTVAASPNTASRQMTLTKNTDEGTVSEKIAQLSAIQFNLPQMPAVASTRSDSDTISTRILSTTELQALEKNHFGLMAAQLQQIYPDLVYENQNGDLCINYIEMIPLLVESIKELKAEIATLQTGGNGGAVVMSRAIGDSNEGELEKEDALVIPMLKQNNPNPFTENTVIEYSLPETVQTANIYIYDMNGAQIMQIPVTDRGLSSTTVNGGQLNAGMYIYSLIADGKVIDTKRMILTK